MEWSCNVIDDLLPLYADEACGQDTAAMVEEHLASCPRCRARLKRMQGRSPLEVTVRQRQEEAWILKKSILAKIKRTVLGVTVAALMLLLLAVMIAIWILSCHTY